MSGERKEKDKLPAELVGEAAYRLLLERWPDLIEWIAEKVDEGYEPEDIALGLVLHDETGIDGYGVVRSAAGYIRDRRKQEARV